MMNHIHFHKSQMFLQAFLFERYESIKQEEKPICEKGLIVQEKVTTLSRLIGKNPITEVISNMSKIIRVEAENPYSLHRCIPSARNMFSNLMVMYVPFQEGADVFQYDYVCEDFIYVKHEKTSIVTEPTLVFKYDHDNIGRLYGRFGFFLSLLDAGHQINHIQETISVRSVIEYFPNSLRKYDDEILASFTFPQSLIGLKYNEAIEKIDQKYQYATTTTTYDLYAGFREEIDNDLITIRRAIEPKVNDSYLSSCYLRTSFQSYQGLMFFDTDKVCKVVDMSPHKELIDGLSLVFVDCKNKGIYGGKDVAFDALKIERLLHDSHEYVNMKAVRMIIFTVMKKRDYSPKEIAASFVQSAELINEISSYYANDHFITRCLRNIDDYYVKENLVNCEYVTYQLMVGDNDIDEFLKGVV